MLQIASQPEPPPEGGAGSTKCKIEESPIKAFKSPVDFIALSPGPEKAKLHADAVASLLGLSTAERPSRATTLTSLHEWTVLSGKTPNLRIAKRLSPAETYSRTFTLPLNYFETLFGNAKSSTALVQPVGASLLALAVELTPDKCNVCLRAGPLFNNLKAQAGDALMLMEDPSADVVVAGAPPRAVASLLDGSEEEFKRLDGPRTLSTTYEIDHKQKQQPHNATEYQSHRRAPTNNTRQQQLPRRPIRSTSASPTSIESLTNADATAALLAAATPASEEPVAPAVASRLDPACDIWESEEGTGTGGGLDDDDDDDVLFEEQRDTSPESPPQGGRRARNRKRKDYAAAAKGKSPPANAKTRRSRGSGSAANAHLSCTHCGTTETPRWWKDAFPCGCLCNACGIWLKRHGYPRPVQYFGPRGSALTAATAAAAAHHCASLHNNAAGLGGAPPATPAVGSGPSHARNTDAHNINKNNNNNMTIDANATMGCDTRGPSATLTASMAPSTASMPMDFYLINGRPKRHRAAAPLPGKYSAAENDDADAIDTIEQQQPGINFDAAGSKVFVIRRKLIAPDGLGGRPSALVHFGWSRSGRAAHQMYDAVVAYGKGSEFVSVEDFELLGETRATASLCLRPGAVPPAGGWDGLVKDFVGAL